MRGGVVACAARDFADMMHDLRGNGLPAWMDRVLTDDLPALRSLVNGMKRNLNAVTAGLSTPWSSGQFEGHVTRDKLLKRMGYGRANLDLLRRRILLMAFRSTPGPAAGSRPRRCPGPGRSS